MRITIPTALTLFRILLLPVMVIVFYSPFKGANIAAAIIFVAAAITDWLDGWIARRWNMGSAFGEFLDPVADKLMVAAALILLVELGRAEAYLAIIIIGREIAISALREWMAQIGQSKSVAVNILGKVKTVTQLVAIPFLLFNGILFGWFHTVNVGRWLIWIAAIITLWSMVVYLRAAIESPPGPPPK